MKLKWAVLVPYSDLIPVLRRKHNDYIPGFRWVPRRWTAFLPTPWDAMPRQIAGSNPDSHHMDIPLEGTWVLARPWFFAWFSRRRYLVRLGMRYDYVDIYYNFDISFKRVIAK